MTSAVTKKQMCVLINSGVEVWVDDEKVGTLAEDLVAERVKGFITIGGRTINSFHIVGIFSPNDMEEMKRRKNGEFKCDNGEWHQRGQVCECALTRIGSDGKKERFVKGTGWVKEM